MVEKTLELPSVSQADIEQADAEKVNGSATRTTPSTTTRRDSKHTRFGNRHQPYTKTPRLRPDVTKEFLRAARQSPPKGWPSAFSQEFVLVSCDGIEVSFPVYDLMASSGFFRDLLQIGPTELRIQLEESFTTIDQFRQLYYSRKVVWRTHRGEAPSNLSFFNQVLELFGFLDKYDCASALKDLTNLMARGFTGYFSSDPYAKPSSVGEGERGLGNGELPPLILFAAGALAACPELCKAALDLRLGCWSDYDAWTQPPGVADLQSKNTLHPLGIPYQILTKFAFGYALALALTNVPEEIDPLEAEIAPPYGAQFIENLNRIMEAAKRAEGSEEE